ncbi:TIGR03557 family F420-dependent LLM class oxidoreductase [Micromonospora sp. M12]
MDAQGQSPFVWSMIGALSQVCSLPVTTAVTCPTVRLHPAVIAQAAATSAVLHGGRFVLGVGTGEALNEHIFGDAWPQADVRLEMLEEAVEVLRALWDGGFVNHHGKHYTVENARIYTLPETPPSIYVSGFGPKAIDLAARIGDGYVSTLPDGEMVRRFRENGGGDKPCQAGFKAAYADSKDEGMRIAYERWPNAGCRVSCPRCSLTATLRAGRRVGPAGDAEGRVRLRQQRRRPPGDDRPVRQGRLRRGLRGQHRPHYQGLFDLYQREVLPACAEPHPATARRASSRPRSAGGRGDAVQQGRHQVVDVGGGQVGWRAARIQQMVQRQVVADADDQRRHRVHPGVRGDPAESLFGTQIVGDRDPHRPVASLGLRQLGETGQDRTLVQQPGEGRQDRRVQGQRPGQVGPQVRLDGAGSRPRGRRAGQSLGRAEMSP